LYESKKKCVVADRQKEKNPSLASISLDRLILSITIIDFPESLKIAVTETDSSERWAGGSVLAIDSEDTVETCRFAFGLRQM
jgi:hypothetical protein